MVEIVRRGALLMLVTLVMTGAAFAQPRTTAPAPTSEISDEQSMTEKARADRAERDLAIQTAILQSEERQQDKAYSRFEILIGFFGALITGIVIFFALRTERAAAAAARKELEDAQSKIDALSKRAEAASTAAEVAAARANEALTKTETAATVTASMRERAEFDAEKTAAFYRETAAIIETSAVRSTGTAKPELTEEQTQKLRLAVEDSAMTPEAEWTVDQFKTAIGKATSVDRNWQAAYRLAVTMANVHAADPNALAYALNRRGDAQRELGQDSAALESFEKSIEVLQGTTTGAAHIERIWAEHSRGVLLGALARYAEAEKVLTALVPRYKRMFGVENIWMLRLRYELGRVVLEQGRAAEAVAILRENLQQSEKLDEPEHYDMILTRIWLALAEVEAGDAAAASDVLKSIPTSIDDRNWDPRYLAGLAFARGRTADALGDRTQADAWLREAGERYAASYPPDNPRRQRVENYVASRNSQGESHG